MSIDLNGFEFKIATNQDPPFFDYQEIDGKLRVKEGLEVEILEGLAQKYNFTYKLIDCEGSWGSLFPNKTWSGIIGKLVDQTCDMGLSEISITADRAEYIEFSYPHTISTITYITSPPMFHSKISSMLNFFDVYVWLSFMVTLSVITMLISIMAKLDTDSKFYDFIWIVFENLVRQASKFKDINTIFKLFLGFWLIFCTIFSTIYGNCIYSQIVFPLKLKSIDTIEKLFNAKVRGEILISIIEFTSKFDLMRQSDLAVYRTLSEGMSFYKDDTEGINAVINSNGKNRAHILSREYLNFVSIKYEQGSFYFPPYNDETTFFLDFLAIAYKQNFLYKSQFDETILAMKEAGLFDYWMLIIKSKSQSREAKTSEEQSNFDLHHFDIYFYLLIFGFLVSGLVFVFEFFNKSNRFRKRNYPRRTRTLWASY